MSRTGRRRCWIGLLPSVLMMAAGCGNSNGAAARQAAPSPQVEQPQSKAEKPAASEKPAGPLPKTDSTAPTPVMAGLYQLSVPAGFREVKTRPALTDVENFTWQGSTDGLVTPVICVTLNSELPFRRECEQDMVKTLANFAGGFTKAVKVTIQRQELAERVVIDGIPFTRIRWTGSTCWTITEKAGEETKTVERETPVGGTAYGAVDGDRVICIMALGGFAAHPCELSKLLEESVASFRRRPLP